MTPPRRPGADAFYDQEAVVAALFDEKAVDDAIQVLSDSEVEGTHPDPVRADPPPGQPKAKAPTVSAPPGLFQKAPPPPLPGSGGASLEGGTEEGQAADGPATTGPARCPSACPAEGP